GVLAYARRLAGERPEFRGLDWAQAEGPLRERVARLLQEERAGPARWPLYVVVEKILGTGEALPPDWATCGTSGYDFLNWLNGLFVDAGNADAFTRLYQDWCRDDTPFAEVLYQKKRLILQVALSSELYTLAYQLDRLAQKDRWSRDFTLNSLRLALRE